MNRLFTLLTMVILVSFTTLGQRPTISLTFSAKNNSEWVQLDSIKIMNRTQSVDTVLFYPDTVLTLDYIVGVTAPPDESGTFQVFQNYPNPALDHTMITMYVPLQDEVVITVTDILGRVIIRSERILDQGLHFFRFYPGEGSLFFFNAQWRESRGSIKILRTDMSMQGESSLTYLGSEGSYPKIKAMEEIQDFIFNLGDALLYIGYADTLQSGMLDSPQANKTYSLQFATNIPCPGTPTVEYEGHLYNTIQIFSQCWLKENLNVGTMIPGNQYQSDNDTIEKYCYNDEPDSCAIYGGIYRWNEMMQYTNQQGARGICPPGWHLPTDEEWKVLEGAVDSQHGIGDPEWDLYWNFYGYDAGTNLKTTRGWYGNGSGTDLFGFSGMPGGSCSDWGIFGGIYDYGYWWTSTSFLDYIATYRRLYSISPGVWRDDAGYVDYGFSVRCLKNEDVQSFSPSMDRYRR